MKASLVYTLLFAGSIVLINPWGAGLNLANTGRAEIWTHPKVFVVAAIALFNLFQIGVDNYQRQENTFKQTSYRRILILLWGGYIAVATISTVLSPFPIHSFLGQTVLGDNLVYWLLTGTFSCSNAVLLTVRPDLFKPQLYGFLIGGSILAISIFPQLIDWHIDYTATSGQLSDYDNKLLESGIWRMHMPIGLYSNRGHAAFVLASILGLNLVATSKRWISHKLGVFYCGLIGMALVATQIRAGIIACLVGIIYWLTIEYYQVIHVLYQRLRRSKFVWAGLLTISICAVYNISFLFDRISSWDRDILAVLQNSSTGRLYLWSLATDGILNRPWLGWGFNGFGIAHLFIGDWQGQLSSYIPEGSSVIQIIRIYESTFDFLSADGEIYTGSILSHKAHNLILDLLLSTGILGFIAYGVLFTFSFWHLVRSQMYSVSIIVAVYIIFTQFWFESAQYSHLFWWALSVGAVPQSERGN